jgi:hypothetical protein
MGDLTKADVDSILDLLRNFPADGQVERDGSRKDAGMNAVLLGFIERREVKKPCPTCGHEKFDYGYFAITPAGRALLAFAEQQS